jgi:hypothetical protein
MSLGLVESLSTIRSIFYGPFEFPLQSVHIIPQKNMMPDLFFIVDDLAEEARKFPMGANHTEDDTLTMIFTFTRWASLWRDARYVCRAYPFASPILRYSNFVGLIASQIHFMFPIPTLHLFLLLFALVHVTAMASLALPSSTLHPHFPFLCTIHLPYSKSLCLPP